MEIKLDEEKISEITQKTIADSVGKAVSSWDVQKKVQEIIADSMEKATWQKAIESAMERVDMAEITKALALEVSRNAVASCVILVRESFASLILNARTADVYISNDDKSKLRVEIMRELSGKK